jgi:HSP20 family protein
MVTKDLTLQEKKELAASAERAEAGKFYSPYTDIYETPDAVIVTMEMPGVERSAIDVQLEKGVLRVTGSIDAQRYADLEPIYSEYNVGNFVRSFTLSTKIKSEEISATSAAGVLTIRLPKAAEAVARRIEIR